MVDDAVLEYIQGIYAILYLCLANICMPRCSIFKEYMQFCIHVWLIYMPRCRTLIFLTTHLAPNIYNDPIICNIESREYIGLTAYNIFSIGAVFSYKLRYIVGF